jgi:hypothetical protein
MLAGTTIVPDGTPFVVSDLEQGIRHMALVPRYKRRLFGAAILDALEKSNTTDRFTRSFLPGPNDAEHETGFFFMTLAIPKFELAKGYEGYRTVRRKMLEVYGFSLLEKYRELKRIVGIATECRREIAKGGSSEDLILIEPKEWTATFLRKLEEAKKKLGIMQEGKYKPYLSDQDPEFPAVPTIGDLQPNTRGLNRRQRRTLAAKSRKRNKDKQA